MGFDQSHVDSAFAALGLGPPSPAEVTAIEAVNGPIVWVDYSQSNQTFEFPALPAAQVISELPEVQSQVVPVAQMFDVALGYFPLQKTLASMVASDLTELQLATALVSSQAFANVNNGGVLLDPNQPVSAGLVDALFINTLGHPPSVATLDGFEGLTNAQAFLAFATSDAVSNSIAPNVQGYLTGVVTLATGIIGFDPLPADAVGIVGQSSAMQANGAQIVHSA